MSEHKAVLPRENTHGLLASYVIGFVLSVGFTLVAYFGVTEGWFTGGSPTMTLLVLAIVQFFVQLFFFLHIGRERRPRWKLLMLVLMIFFALVVILGSIWVMYNLNYRMTPKQMNIYMHHQAESGL